MFDKFKNEENDIVLAKFISFMEVVFHNQRINYYRNIKIQNSWEKELQESDVYFDKYLNLDLYDLEILNDKEKELFELHYRKGLTYAEISKITNEKINTLHQRKKHNIDIESLKNVLRIYKQKSSPSSF